MANIVTIKVIGSEAVKHNFIYPEIAINKVFATSELCIINFLPIVLESTRVSYMMTQFAVRSPRYINSLQQCS